MTVERSGRFHRNRLPDSPGPISQIPRAWDLRAKRVPGTKSQSTKYQIPKYKIPKLKYKSTKYQSTKYQSTKYQSTKWNIIWYLWMFWKIPKRIRPQKIPQAAAMSTFTFLERGLHFGRDGLLFWGIRGKLFFEGWIMGEIGWKLCGFWKVSVDEWGRGERWWAHTLGNESYALDLVF